MKQIKTALFVDFDNIFRGLYDLDPDMAIAMADDPGQWLERLKKHSLPEGDERNFLVRRVYLNPNGKIEDTIRGDHNGWQYLSRFRPSLIEAGFEVVDCHPLKRELKGVTRPLKNASDIRIVIDVLECLDSTDLYDEFVIASGDSDFTPLCQKLRAKNRRVTIISCGNTVAAYRNIANFHLDMAAIIDEEEVKKLRDKAKGYVVGCGERLY